MLRSRKCPLATILYSASRAYSRHSKVFCIDIEDSVPLVTFLGTHCLTTMCPNSNCSSYLKVIFFPSALSHPAWEIIIYFSSIIYQWNILTLSSLKNQLCHPFCSTVHLWISILGLFFIRYCISLARVKAPGYQELGLICLCIFHIWHNSGI